jgi:2-C-methyl-D-erythritol 4-phosphate cytidylyltransferase
MSEVKKYAVIVAGGKGVRMGSAIPKQFLPLHGKPMLCYALQAFAEAIPGISLILVLPEGQVGSANTVLRSYLSGINVAIVAGGETRYHSVQNGLKLVHDDGIVFVHDGARPVISERLILHCQDEAIAHGSAVPAIQVTESIRLVDGDGSRTVSRDHLRIIQTPQTFRTDIILPAFRQAYVPEFTDEATVVEAHGANVNLVEGERENIKVTTPEDMILVEALLREHPAMAEKV